MHRSYEHLRRTGENTLRLFFVDPNGGGALVILVTDRLRLFDPRDEHEDLVERVKQDAEADSRENKVPRALRLHWGLGA